MNKPAFQLNETTGKYVATRQLSVADIVHWAKQLLAQQLVKSGRPLTSPADTKDFLMLQLGEFEHEVFAVIFLDNRHRIIKYEVLFTGTLDGCSVHPRVVARRALELNAACCIFGHNHPSGVAEPSKADEQITQRLKDALSLIEVRVLDHMICGKSEPVSFAERGLL